MNVDVTNARELATEIVRSFSSREGPVDSSANLVKSPPRPFTLKNRRSKHTDQLLMINGVVYPPTSTEGVEDYWRPEQRGECTPRGVCDTCGALERLRDSCHDATCSQCGSPLFTNRPCAYVGCKHNMWCDINPKNGSIKVNTCHPWEVDPDCSCCLDIAQRGRILNQSELHLTLDEVGLNMHMTKERVRQIEELALQKIAEQFPELHDYLF